MTLRSILVPVRGDGLGEGVLNHALALARRSDAHLDVVHCRPRPEDLLPYGVYVPTSIREEMTVSAGSLANAEEQRLRSVFDDYCRRHQVKEVEGRPWPVGEVSLSWREETGKQADIVGRLGRLADLVAVARPDHRRKLGLNTLEAALLETGKAVLMCPPIPVSNVGSHVALAWNGSTEAARAVTAAMAILTGADRVTVISVGTGANEPLGAEALRHYLGDHDIRADVLIPSAKSTTVGQALLGAAAEAGADLLLMGAYGQSRWREVVLGGVTQYIIEHSDIPVLLCH